MRTYNNFLLLLALLFIFSCTDQEDFEPQNLIGTWENSFYSEFLNLDHVDTYLFDNNGEYIRYTGYRITGSSNFLGYTMYLEGSYILSGNEILLKEEKRLAHLGEEAYNEIEGLSEVEKIAEVPASLAFKNKGKVLEITTTCNPLLSSSCIPVTAYNKVDFISPF